MKLCSLKCVVKYTLMMAVTSLLTTVVFYAVRGRNEPAARRARESMLFHAQVLQRAEKIDWHDREGIQREMERKGNGEHGIAGTLPPDHDKDLYDSLYGSNGFNAYMSDHISLNRSVPDIRHKKCKEIKYNNVLPDVSVIVPFHNEHWSTLLRTVYSVLNRSPEKLLKEIILVDDASTKAHCKTRLDDFVLKNLPKVKVIHLKSRQGLIRARLAGAHRAVGDVLLFLDSHTEANINWLPPLLDPISEDYRTCVCPFIDVIDYETFEYRAQDEGARGAFDWELFYKRLPLLPEDTIDPTKPFKSPVMAGGLFAISSKFFWELGGYDPGLDIWGGEQYELSFKIWQCGGRMFDAPCSRVGHIYRKFAPFPNPQKGDFVGRNYRRVADVWMDEYAEYIYMRRPHYRRIDPGDLTKQRAIREKLNCKPFKWFMTEIAFDLVKKYPPIEPPDYASGKISTYPYKENCLVATDNTKPVYIVHCADAKKSNEHVNFLLSWHKDIKVKDTSFCLDVSQSIPKSPVNLFGCHGQQGNQLWKYDLESKNLIQGSNNRCMDRDEDAGTVFISDCNNDVSQKWHIETVNEDALSKWDDTEPLP